MPCFTPGSGGIRSGRRAGSAGCREISGRRRLERPTHAGRPSRSPGSVELCNAHPAGAPGGICRKGVPDRRGSGCLRKAKAPGQQHGSTRWQRRSRCDPRLQRLLVGPRDEGRCDPANVARCRSAGRKDSGIDAGGPETSGRPNGSQEVASRGRPRGPAADGALYPLRCRRRANASYCLQQQRSVHPDARSGRDRQRDGPRGTDHRARWTSTSRERRPAVAWGFARPLGRRYPGRRNNQFHRQVELQGIERGSSLDGTFHANCRRHAPLRIHR